MKSDIKERIVTLILLVVAGIGSIWSNAYSFADELLTAVKGEIQTEWKIRKAGDSTDCIEDSMKYSDLRAKDINGNIIPTYLEAVDNYLTYFPFKNEMIDINGKLMKTLNMREIYQNNGGSVLKNGYVVGIYSYTSTDYEIKQIREFKSYLDERGIQLLYVNEPTKYIDDQVVIDELGKATYINNNTDRFLNKLDDNGIQYIDLRDNIIDKNLDSFELFYKTDHHWTTYAGKMAAEAIAKELNKSFGYNIDLSLYDNNKFVCKKYKNAWLGEQGKKLGVTFVGLDNFDLILPDYDTLFNVLYEENVIEGSFDDILVDQDRYLPENNKDVYSALSWHYSYMGKTGINGIKIENKMNVEKKKVLVLGDSYELITVPFLSLGIAEIQCLSLRNYEGSLIEYVNSHEIDTVIIAYASFMIGAHDDEASANYAMFDFS